MFSQINKIAVILLLLDSHKARNVLNKLRNNHPRVESGDSTYCETGNGMKAAKRAKTSPPNVHTIIAAGNSWTDDTFKDTDALYQDDQTRFDSTTENAYDMEINKLYTTGLGNNELYWDRPAGNQQIMSTTKWTSNNDFLTTDYKNVIQNSVTQIDSNPYKFGDNNVVAAMSAIAQFPNIVSKVVRVQTNNDAGIYGFRFYIRGQPWDVVVDNKLLYKKNGSTPYLYHAQYFPNSSVIWPALMEKAYAKLIGSYAAISNEQRGAANELRIFTGAPVMEYTSTGDATNTASQQIFTQIEAGYAAKYVMIAQATITQNPTCGLKKGGNYVVLATFKMTDENSVEISMYLLRDPQGKDPTYTGDWHKSDSKWDTCGAACLNAVPLGVNPKTSEYYDKGLFVSPISEWVTGNTCFQYAYIAHYREYLTTNEQQGDYIITKFDMDNYDSTNNYYSRFGSSSAQLKMIMGSAVSGDVYFQVETYPIGMVPRKCLSFATGGTTYYAPDIVYTVSSNGADVFTHHAAQYQTKTNIIAQNDYYLQQGSKLYTIVLDDIDFKNGAQGNTLYPTEAMEYTVSAYHDKRNALIITQNNAVGGLSANVAQPHSVSYNGVFETGLDGFNDGGSTGIKWGYLYDCTTNSNALGCFTSGSTAYNTRTTETDPYMFGNFQPTNSGGSSNNNNLTPTTQGSKALPSVGCLAQCFSKADNFEMFLDLFFYNPWVIFWWFCF